MTNTRNVRAFWAKGLAFGMLVTALPASHGNDAEDFRSTRVGDGSAFVLTDESSPGFQYLRKDGVSIELIDLDSDGKADFMRYQGVPDAQGCVTTSEDNNLSGTADFIWRSCTDSSLSSMKIYAADAWHNVIIDSEGMRVVIDGVVRPVAVVEGRSMVLPATE